MSGAIFAYSMYGTNSLQTHTFHFTSSNHGLHIDNKLVATFYIFSQVVNPIYPIIFKTHDKLLVILKLTKWKLEGYSCNIYRDI